MSDNYYVSFEVTVSRGQFDWRNEGKAELSITIPQDNFEYMEVGNLLQSLLPAALNEHIKKQNENSEGNTSPTTEE